VSTKAYKSIGQFSALPLSYTSHREMVGVEPTTGTLAVCMPPRSGYALVNKATVSRFYRVVKGSNFINLGHAIPYAKQHRLGKKRRHGAQARRFGNASVGAQVAGQSRCPNSRLNLSSTATPSI
jgi:hypothetical protein